MRTLRNTISWIFLAWIVLVWSSLEIAGAAAAADNALRIRPYQKNTRYWQYQGRPVMLLGASRTDHIFLLDDLESHLDAIAAIGGNYVRNTMSQREEQHLKPYKLLPDGKFDLSQWNDDYWQRFENMLRWTAEREIIVQIEIWDRFDYTDAHGWNIWQMSPWRPANNINYTSVETGLADTYPDHPSEDKQPFFHSIPGMQKYQARYDVVRRHQQRFVAKLLSYSLGYGHLLYCVNNETSTEAAWGRYWIQFIKRKAEEQGVTVCTTDMFDDAFDADKAEHTPVIFDDAEHYMFADVSQVNSQIYDDAHWERLRLLLKHINKHPRPTNHVKIYGGGYSSWGSGALEDAVERFWRDLLGGSAAVRFHRPHRGSGLTERTTGSIKAARLLETLMPFWELTPRMDLLSARQSNEAYLAARPGKQYALYFTHGGSVGLDLSAAPGRFEITWISVSEGVTTRTTSARVYARTEQSIEGGRVVTLSAPYKGGWIAALVRK